MAPSPFGGLANFIACLGQIAFALEVQRPLPFMEPTSNNAIPLANCSAAFLMSVVVGAQLSAHCQAQSVDGDRRIHAAGEFRGQFFGWTKVRRFVVVREQVWQDKEAVRLSIGSRDAVGLNRSN